MNENQEDREKSEEDSMIGTLIFDRYKLIKRLGAGSFGCIYSAEFENQYYAIKLENKSSGQNLLENEAYIMSYLNGPGLPVVKSYGYSSKHNILVMELMGKSLEDIFESFVVKKMTPRCVCNIGYQMMEIMEFIHKKHIIHRDIKPDNFVVGRGAKKKYIYILDFGLAKKYRSSRTLEHYAVVKSKNLVGTARYASINALNGLTQSRRDDLEAIGYVLMYFLRGRLPWQGIPVKNKEERYRKIMEKKIATSAEELCQGYPEEFTNYINYTRNLQYEQDPDYAFLKNLFINVLKKEGHIIDCYYDWDKMTIRYFRDFENYKIKKEKSEKNINITPINKNNEINTLNEGKYNQVNNTNNTNKVLTTMNNMDYTMNTFISNKNISKVNNSIQNNKKYLINNKNHSVENNNNITSNISMHKNVINATNYEGSALRVNDMEQINKPINTNNENINMNKVQTNNYLGNNDNMNNNFIGNNNADNNIENNNNKTKKNKEEKDNCCCLIF